MTEKGNSADQAENTNKEFSIQKIYCKDVSFETPNSPEIFREQWQPEVNLQIGNATKILAENIHEIVLTVTVTAKLGDKTAYLVEVQQAGIFNIINYTQEEMGIMVGAYCPTVLFPYVREVVSDIVTKGGFPQLLLAPVNFDALYQQHLQQQNSAKTEQSNATTH
ncbi:MAG: protein-export chaperone SecB [Gammaproteobacteria bacterium]|nr:protein-export chaperone SecB [Gammaproteobacteria bacterium]MDH5728874.1 protein-export chaperone SecB [Gammaproteobacteria bacterium]